MQEKKLIRLAQECLMRKTDTRPEVKRLQALYERYRQMHGSLKKAEADRQIFFEISGRAAERPSDTLKIRYWRTGQHNPANRETCEAFARALKLDGAERLFLIQEWDDRCDQAFETEPSEACSPYWRRRRLMEELQWEYLIKANPRDLLQERTDPGALKKNFRHLYYADAANYIAYRNPEQSRERTVSMSYHSELQRTIHLLGEIPRRTMLRHLVVLSVPYISRRRLDYWLRELGYLGLDENHTQLGAGGVYLDWMLIRFLELYEESCAGKAPEECKQWFQESCRILDEYFVERHEEGLRFMYFKALMK